MSNRTGIEWTDATWNPTTGCTKVSPGCAHCYIERTPAFRIHGRKFVNGHVPLQLHTDRLDQPYHWKKPRRVFVNSLSDLFHEDVPFSMVVRVFSVMAANAEHQFQVLTKRPAVMRECVTEFYRAIGVSVPFPNIWLGVSVENQHFADKRIPLLLDTPAAIRFISAEPLLERIEIYDGLRDKKGGDMAEWPSDLRIREFPSASPVQEGA